MATVSNLTLLTALVIGPCVTCTNPILSQAIAKGPFADKYVARPLQEIISAEAGANDGFGFLFLMPATYLLRHADIPGAGESAEHMVARSEEVGHLNGGVCEALKKLIENESYVLFPTTMSLFIVGTCGTIGNDDLLAYFVADSALN
ncbi:hypothetical protein IWW34DRAFT_854844 [Fusarium oxysporum f. sp. albedinis]|nr:hypothetical protein IWW34DRAFT_854844 [Fusarium oxysporum f. sp. albedinis]